MSTETAGWPLVLTGPLPRRIDPRGVSVFVACKHPRRVRLSIYDGTEPDPGRRVHEQGGDTVPLGRFLHAAVVTAHPPAPLRSGRVYGYDLGFERAGPARPGDDGPATADLGSLGELDRLGYEPGRLPSFTLPAERLSEARFAHGSCRKPHGARRDALATLDQILETTHADPIARPQQLFLTGDQIYADDADPALLALAGSVGRAALGWDRPEVLPGVRDDDFALAPTRRDPLVRQQAGYTGGTVHCHLMTLAEYVGMYLLVWSDALWPRYTGGAPTLPPAGAEFADPRWGEPAHRRAYAHAVRIAAHSRPDVLEFARTLPRVRRALANIATYMIFDDHDVTDDWNLHREWFQTVHRRPLGRRLVRNALSAYAVFQGWGNEPAQFAPEQPGGRLLAALGGWAGAEGATAETIAAHLGLPSDAVAPPIRYDYQVDTPAYQVIVLDTRTVRGFRKGGSGRAAPALLSRQAMRRQLADRLSARTREVPITVVVSAAPVFGHPFIEAWVQLKKIRAIEWFKRAPAAVDREAWALHGAAFQALLATLARFGRVVILSGDVHYGFAGSVAYWDGRDGPERPARFVQCTSSALKGEDNRTRLVGGVPSVKGVPAVLGDRIERLLGRLTSPPPLSFLGWPAESAAGRTRIAGRGSGDPVVRLAPLASAHRRLDPPRWRYRVDFQSDVDIERHPPGRNYALHRLANDLRVQHGWSLMHCIVGRNNLGDIEFLLADDGSPAGMLRQSLWFDKTAIRPSGEPARLPYTVYDLPLALPAVEAADAPAAREAESGSRQDVALNPAARRRRSGR